MRTLLAAVAALSLAVPASADVVGDFETRIRREYLKPFALDLGGVMGSASAHTGRALGMPGFWAGGIVSVQNRPNKDNRVLRDSGVKSFGIPLLEVGVGLPFKIDVIAHGLQVDEVKMFGGGLRYGLYKTDLIDTALPNLSVSGFYDKLDHPDFSARHGAFNATASWNFPIVKPFFVAGVDITEMRVEGATTPGVQGAKETARGSRFSAGASLTPFPFVDLRGSFSLRHGEPGFDVGLGARF